MKAFAPTRLLALLLAIAGFASPSFGQNQGEDAMPGGEPGASSPGFPGMEDSESIYLSGLRKAGRSGKRSRAYIGALLELGMHYNRANRPADASRVLREALTIVDGGALGKPTPPAQRVPDRIITNNNGATASATIIRHPLPYEEMVSELLPQLIAAEIGANQLPVAEAHVKRLIAFADTDEVKEKLNKATAYMSWAEICRKQGRMKEAATYQKKADDIHASFTPL